jgi:3-hydroxyisobutyrate dehydrogenase
MSNGHQAAERPSRVAVLGAGTMGGAMAQRLLGAGFGVVVWSRHIESTTTLTQQGATAHGTAAEAAADADVIITMLPTAEVTRAVMFGASALQAMTPGSIWTQMATVGVDATERFAAEAARSRPDVTFVDAPVSGSRAPAEAGQLLILASGEESAAQRLQPVFGALGRATLWLGPAGGGSRLKLVLNTWLAFQAEGAAEAAALAERLGVADDSLLAALRGNPLASDYGIAKLEKMMQQDFHADFSLDWALKDLDLAVSEGGADAAPIAHAISERWQRLVDTGSSGLDVSAARQGLGAPAASP